MGTSLVWRDVSGTGLEIALSDLPDSEVFRTFFAGYDRAFVLPDEKEDEEGFAACLALNHNETGQRLAAQYGRFKEICLIAREEGSETFVGGANFIAMAILADGQPLVSANLNYIYVDAKTRGKGHFGRLIAAVRAAIGWAMESASDPLIFIELNDPIRMSDENYARDTAFTGLDQLDRLRIWTRQGARIVDHDYAQPPLDEDQSPDLTLIYGVLTDRTALSACTLRHHLQRFFAVSVLKGRPLEDVPVARSQIGALDILCDAESRVDLLDPAAAAFPGWPTGLTSRHCLRSQRSRRGRRCISCWDERTIGGVAMKAVRRRNFNECAIFPNLEGVGISFAFEISPPARGADLETRRTAFRLVALSRRVKQTFGEAQDHDRAVTTREAHEALIEPVESFLDDVTNGEPGVNGRPLLLLASGAEAESPTRRVTLHRPEQWLYKAEGDDTMMGVDRACREIELLLRDSFCVFESGLIYYVLTLVEPPREKGSAPRPSLDEYALLQLQQLLLDRERANDADYLSFKWGDEKGVSFLDFAAARLRSLKQTERNAETGDALPNAVVDILQPFGLLRERELPLLLGDHRLVSLCLSIEDGAMQKVVNYAIDKYAGQSIAWPKALAGRSSSRWRTRALSRGQAHERAEEEIEPGDDKIERAVLAVAGLATGVCDFPFQDTSEVHDSTRPASHSIDSALFTHPRFMLEIAAEWRSFQRGVSTLGGCPYLLLTWLTAVHDQQIVFEMEHDLETLIYGSAESRKDEPDSERFRAAPLADVMALLDSSSKLWGRKTGVQEHNLRERLEIFRWQSIHRCGNIFRYAKENAALSAVRDKLGIDHRFKEVHEALDRLENLVDDVSTLSSAYAQRYTNRALGVLTLLGLLAIPKSLNEFWETVGGKAEPLLIIVSLLIVGAMAFLYFFRPRGPTFRN